MSYKRSWHKGLVGILVLLLVFGSMGTLFASEVQTQNTPAGTLFVTFDDGEVVFVNNGEPFQSEALHFHVFYYGAKVESAQLVLADGTEVNWTGQGSENADLSMFELGYWHWVYTPSGILTISNSEGTNLENENLKVSKTVVTSFDREHFWDIDKKVETEKGYELDDIAKIWLYIDGSGDETATWTVDVTYEGFEDDNHNVSGTVTIENTGNVAANITGIEDLLAGESIEIDFGVDFELPYFLAVGESLVGTYDVDGYFEGDNVVTVTTAREKTYSATEPILWGDPENEVNKTVNIKDVSDLFGEEDLGSVTAPNGDSFTYDQLFEWTVDAVSDVYDNTATIVETRQSADAQLKVNVQEFVFEGDTAWAANENDPGELRYTQRGNWATYVKYEDVAKTTTLFAGQNIEVGTVDFSAPAPVDGKVTITVNLTGDWEFEDVAEYLKVQDYKSAPSGNPSPGLFDHKISEGNTITVPQNNFYGVHVNVGQWVPDPDFGPEE